MKNYSEIEYKDYKRLSFTFREIYIKGIFSQYTVFCAGFLDNKNAYLLSFFFNTFERHIKNKNDFDKFIDNFEKNINILNTITDTLIWNFNSKLKGTEKNFKDSNKTILFKTNIVKPYYQNIEKMYKIDTVSFLIVEVDAPQIEHITKEYNLSQHAFKYDLSTMIIEPNLYSGIWQ